MRHLMLVLLLLVAACSLPPADPQREAQVDQVFEAVKRQDRTSLEAMATEALRTNLSDQDLAAMADYVPEGTPDQVETVSWQSSIHNTTAAYRIVRQYEYRRETVIFDTLMSREEGGQWQVDGVHINRVSAAQAAIGRFSLVNKSAVHYGVLAFVVLTPIVCLATASIAGVRRRWGWMAFSLLGVGQIVFDWGTGALGFQALYVSLLGAAFTKGPLATDPWLFSFGLPIPALLFWALGKWRPKPSRKPTDPPPAPGLQ